MLGARKVTEHGEKQRHDPAAVLSGYEQLREAVLSGRADGFRLGHGVLAARGILAWSAAFNSLAPAPAAAGARRVDGETLTSASSVSAGPGGGVGSLPSADQLVAVLTQMVLPLAA
jgi:hypothetical protein